MTESDREYNIDWDKLKNGLPPEAIQEILGEILDSENVEAVQNLQSESLELRSQAIERLFDTAYHQGTLMEPAFIITLIFIRQLQDESESVLIEDILLCLAYFISGISFLDYAIMVDSFMNPDLEMPETPDPRNATLPEDRLIYEAIERSIEIFLDFLTHSSPDVRVAAIYLLSCCRSEKENIYDRVNTLFYREIDEMVKVTVFFYFAVVSRFTVVDVELIERIANSGESDIIKLSAAIALAYISGTTISEKNIDILIDLLEKPNLLTKLIEHYDYPMSSAHHLIIIDFFGNLSDRHLSKVLPSLIEANQAEYSIDYFSEILIFKTRKDAIGKTYQQLTESQKLLLRISAQDESLFNERSYICKILNLESRGLTEQQMKEKILNFIGQDIPISS
ncbi:MAG: hypothetical protein AAGA60_08740 [Cyanobacteria bacterium P01_E01_bin.42]